MKQIFIALTDGHVQIDAASAYFNKTFDVLEFRDADNQVIFMMPYDKIVWININYKRALDN